MVQNEIAITLFNIFIVFRWRFLKFLLLWQAPLLSETERKRMTAKIQTCASSVCPSGRGGQTRCSKLYICNPEISTLRQNKGKYWYFRFCSYRWRNERTFGAWYRKTDDWKSRKLRNNWICNDMVKSFFTLKQLADW